MDRNQLVNFFLQTRQLTELLCQPLYTEDYVVQGCDDVSPIKWHLAHTTWFWETFILAKKTSYKIFDPIFPTLFNSYYQTLSTPYPRPKRGLLSRPAVKVVYQYRRYVTEKIIEWLSCLSESEFHVQISLVLLGINHEQQHQELLMMDIKYNLSLNFGDNCYQKAVLDLSPSIAEPLHYHRIKSTLATIGQKDSTFCFDNERPSHKVFLNDFAIADRLVTNGEYMEFIQSKGYEDPALWLADGWDWLQANEIQAPLYWQQKNTEWQHFTLAGMQSIDPNAPVVHVSFFEAEAFARFSGQRLPTEAEWEYFVESQSFSANNGNFLENKIFQPQAKSASNPQFYGDVWEWTSSAYTAYPGYTAAKNAFGEYNGKFMNNQRVLKGGSCVTPLNHIRASYRNFFQPEKRWQFSGIRLARDI